MNSLLTAIIISSPAPSNPSLDLIHAVVASLNYVEGIGRIIIVLDGYKISKVEQSKKGKITQEMAELYEHYVGNIIDFYGNNPKYMVLRCPSHYGFAMAVRFGLLNCTTEFCVVCQHDRVFLRKINDLDLLIDAMQNNSSIRYIGFPSSTNCWHESMVKYRYGLHTLTSIPNPGGVGEDKPSLQVHLSATCFLQPLVFWYDSNHLCHVQRYLQIYTPFKSFPAHLTEKIGASEVAKMILRAGDFIEDRFGQAQRNLLVKYKDTNDFDELVRWFGCYLYCISDTGKRLSSSDNELDIESNIIGKIEDNDAEFQSDLHGTIVDGDDIEGRKEKRHISFPAMIFVAHIRGRQYDVEAIQHRLKLISDDPLYK